jgi:threonine/homoserine efflux transporter RhtA
MTTFDISLFYNLLLLPIGINQIQQHMWAFSIVLLYTVVLCSSLAPTKVERVGKLSKYIYSNFVLIDDRDQR